MSKVDNELLATFALSRTGLIGPMTFQKLLDFFGTAENAWRSPLSKLREVGLTTRMLEEVGRVKSEVDLLGELGRLGSLGVRLLRPVDEDYPQNLKTLRDAPFLLYVLGEIRGEDSRAVAVVGSRKQSSYGRLVIEDLVPELTREGLTIVSGLALGNDALAHKVAMDAGGRTIAVLGSGILRITPMTCRSLGERIYKSGFGAVISEFPPMMEPFPHNFLFRNRILSGLSLGVIVIEASEKSGTLSTAAHALEQGREVFAVPGDIHSPLSRGPHRLISMGATLVSDAASVLQGLGLDSGDNGVSGVGGEKGFGERDYVPQSSEEEVVLVLLQEERHLDEVIRESGLLTEVVSSTVSLLQLKGVVLDCGGGRFRRKR